MKFTLILGVLCIIGSVAAQQYSSAVPQRPTAFAAATPTEPLRTRQRQRARTLEQPSQIQSETPAAPTRPRGRGAVRARNLVQEDQASRARISTGSDDVYVRPARIQTTTAAPVTQPPRPVTPKPVVEEEEEGDYISEEVDDGSSEEAQPPTNTISRSAYVGPFQPLPLPPNLQGARPLGPIQSQQQQQPPQYTRPPFLQPTAFRPSQPLNPQPSQPQPLPNSQSLGVVKQAPRPAPIPQLRPLPQVPLSRPQPATPPPHNHISEEEEEEDDEPQYVRQPPSRQQAKRPQSAEVDAYRPQSKTPAPARQQQLVRNQDTSRPYPSKASTSQRERKPVVQTIRKYHNDNEDGSITWGYENDDGTFKEETIGVDCVTRGKYGYVDPDGLKREYTYQTGIPCNREEEAEQAASSNEGYIDYTNNKYVFPNGDEIDLDDMVKNRARKPSGKFRY